MSRCWTLGAIAALVLSACEPQIAPPDPRVEVSRVQAAALFGRYCAICHGEFGDGRGPRRASLHRKPTDFRRPSWRAGRALGEIEGVIRNGSPGTDMPAWKMLDDGEITGLAEYVTWLGTEQGRRDTRARRTSLQTRRTSNNER
jgi:mono/diheme cytochrome c family protein